MSNRRGVVCLNDGRFFERMVTAAEYYGIHKNDISSACAGRQRLAKGRFFVYAEGPLEEEERERLLAEKRMQE